MKRILTWVRASTLAPLAVAVVVYLAIGYSAGYSAGFDQKEGGNPSILIRAGADFAKKRSLLPDDIKLIPQTGYDGQFYFYLAQDPFLTGKVARRADATTPVIDHLGYRYQRILFPLAGWLASGGTGDPNVLEWALPLLNLLAVLGSGFMLARFLAARGRSPWWSLLYTLSLGMLAGFVNDLADPFATGLFVAGLIWWYGDRRWWAVVALTLTLLTRETFLVPVTVLALAELVRSRRGALPFLIPTAVWAVWQVYLRAALTAPIVPPGAERPQLLPIAGALDRFKLISEQDVVGAANWEISFILLLLVICGYLIWSAGVVVLAALRDRSTERTRDDVLVVVAAASVLLVPFFTSELWRNIPSYARYSAPAAALLMMLFAVRGSRVAAGLAVALGALTLVNPVIGFVPTANGFVISSAPPPPPPRPAAVRPSRPSASAGAARGGRAPSVARFRGFGVLERGGGASWRWAVSPSSSFDVVGSPGAAATLQAWLAVPPNSRARVRIEYPGGGSQSVELRGSPAPVVRRITLKRGRARVVLHTDTPSFKVGRDPRTLYVQLRDLSVRRG